MGVASAGRSSPGRRPSHGSANHGRLFAGRPDGLQRNIRRRSVVGGAAAVFGAPLPAQAAERVTLGLTPVVIFAAVQEIAPGLPMIFVTAFGGIDQAVRLVKAGAANYLTNPSGVCTLLDRLAELVRPAAVTGALGASAPMQALEAMLRRVARLGSTLLITGESGAGKEVAARFAPS